MIAGLFTAGGDCLSVSVLLINLEVLRTPWQPRYARHAGSAQTPNSCFVGVGTVLHEQQSAHVEKSVFSTVAKGGF